MLDASESGSSKQLVKKQSNNDAHGYVISDIVVSLQWLLTIVLVYIHTAWASALLVLTSWAMPEPRCVGRVTGRLPRFFCI